MDLDSSVESWKLTGRCSQKVLSRFFNLPIEIKFPDTFVHSVFHLRRWVLRNFRERKRADEAEGFPVIILSIQDHGNVAFVSRCDDDVLVINPLNASSSAVVMFLEGQRALFRIPAIATLADSACKISFCLRKTGPMLERISFRVVLRSRRKVQTFL